MKTKNFLLLLFVLITNICQVQAKSFTLFTGKNVAQIYVSDSEPMPLKIAAQYLRDDIAMVTGVTPEIITDDSKLSGNIIILSTKENNKLINSKQLDGLRESYMIRSVSKPYRKVYDALVVVGSDALGAVYGAFNISEMIGVSPLYWWCDIEPKRVSEVIINNCEVDPSEPSVRYRGIFINDEEAMINWSRITSLDKTKGAISPETYKRVFELMLRLKANTLWPSMMEAGSYFFEFKDENGVAINPKNATDYGIYIGTSHCENMACNNYAEWYEWAADHKELFAPGDTKYEFDYTVNKEAIEIYWMERLRESKDFNMIYTMGIRGVHDSPFQCRLLENPTLENRVKLLQKVINRQREMLKEVFGSEDAVPQIFVPYEETAELYNGESKNGEEKCQGLELPEDIIIVSTEDNYGYLRQLPTEKELARKGGCGIYYHLAYQGFPSPYDWITTMPYKLMQQELNKLYKVGSTDFWIVNVGDIKSCELGLNYFMKIANDNEKYLNMNPRDYVKDMAVSLFGMNKSHAEDFADYYTRFCLSANMQKPEFMSSFWSIEFKENNVYGFKDLYSFYSVADFGDEAERKIDELRALEAEAKKFYDSLPEENKIAFWHLSYYPVRATRMMAEKSYYFHKNIYYADQGRLASVNGYKYLSEKAAAEIDKDLEYYNKELCNGKWNGIMDPYADYNMFERILDIASIPKKFVYKESFAEQGKDGIGSVCEGQLVGDEDVSLLFSSLENNIRFIDIFNKGIKSQKWSIKGSKSWINFSVKEGEVRAEERVKVSIDWEKAKNGVNEAVITVSGKDGEVKTYPVVANKFNHKIKSKSYVEGAGFVAIEAENYSKMINGKNGAKWVEVDDLGYSGSTMSVTGKGKVQNGVGGAVLEYNVYFTSAGEFDGILYRIPTLNEGKDKSCEIAVGVDGGKPTVLEGVRRKSQSLVTKGADGTVYRRNWQAGVFAQMEKMPFKITVDKPGYHTFKVYQVDRDITFDRVVIATTKQSSIAQKRSLMGAPESYNNISKTYKPLEVVGVNKDINDVSALKSYPRPEPLFYSKFFFTKHGCPEVWGFTNVCKSNVYEENINLFGWDKNDVDNIIYRHNESTRLVPHFRRDYHLSRKPATFYVSLHEGDYEVTIFTGEITNYLTGNKGQTYKMNLKANGKVLMENEIVESDELLTKTYDVKVGRDHLLKLDFSGEWGISAIEIYKK